jgi:AcrR family transcriptional regulator
MNHVPAPERNVRNARSVRSGQNSKRNAPAKVNPPTLRGQQTAQLLFEAAEAVFGELGYDNASVSMIVQRAGVAQGTFYRYFSDKKGIFVELVHSLNDRLREEVLAAMEGVSGRMNIERARFLAFFRFVRAHRNLYRIVRQAEFVDEALYRWYYQRLAEGYALGLEGSMESGEIRRLDPELLAYALMGVADFIGMRYSLWGQQPISDACFNDLISFLERGLAS